MRLLRLLGYQPRSCHSSSRKNSFWSGSKVRQTFLDYFEREQHLIVPSSSVIPTKLRGESPLPFVNAGMVKWRPIFTDEVQPPARFMDGVANSQKCIRIGGKACDLEQVGHDGHHHTFFEMLGSWAFNGSYGRTRSFQLAWDLLTKGYELPKDRLYVTYFSGCDKLGLPPDIESKEAWLALGLDLDRIHPMGVSDNFWQMGVDGPCGPCTEIYYSRDGSPDQKSWLEVWNLVFMEHNLHLDGSLSPLKHHHVDTGMGLERMTAIVSAMTSNYDTDLFTPLFDIIAKESNSRPYTGNFTE
jgi:alanyl-tRNA synthetase